MLKTAELIGPELDWAVAKCYGYDEGWLLRQLTNPDLKTRSIPNFSTDWAEGGPVIEQQKIDCETYRYGWRATIYVESAAAPIYGYGPTPLIAAMRCYVTSQHTTRKNIC